MRLRGTAIIAALALSGCNEAPPIYPDWCTSSGQKLSDGEKISATLAYIHEHINDPAMEYYRRVTVGRFARRYANSDNFIKAYTLALPDCCEVYRPPTYIEWYSAQRSVGFSERELIGNPGDWVADVAIERKSPNWKAKHRLWPDFKVSNCNHVSLIERG